MTSKFWEKNIELDVKLVRGLVLTYIIYGIIYLLEIDVFLVPLPMVYVFVPLAGLFMFIRTWKNEFSTMFLLIPMVVLKDFFVGEFPKMAELIVFFAILVWVIWSLNLFFKQEKNHRWISLLQTPVVLLLFDLDAIIMIIAVLSTLVGATIFVRKYTEDKARIADLRIAILIQLLGSLYCLQLLSEYSAN